MNPLLSIRCFAIALTAFTAFASASLHSQEITPDRFGIGVSGIAGWFGGYSAVMPGLEGFVRVARSSFWSARVDGAFYARTSQDDIVCAGQGTGGCGDSRFIGKIGTLVATVTFGPTASIGLRPLYGLVGTGGLVTSWGGGSCSMDVTHCGGGVASGLGPVLALIEAGIGTEFRALGGNRIEFRIHRASRSLSLGSPDRLAAVGSSLTIGVVW